MTGGPAGRTGDAHEPSLHSSLLEAAWAGDLASFADLVQPYRARLSTVARLVVGSAGAGDAALDDALLRAWRGLRGYRGQTSFEVWLTRVVTTTCLRMPSARPLAASVGLQSLPVRQRAVLVLSDELGWEPAEIALALGVPEPTVRTSLRRGREHLGGA